MILCSLDLELEQPGQEICEIGLFIWDTDRGIEFGTKHSFLINIGRPISDYIVKLCSYRGIDFTQFKDLPTTWNEDVLPLLRATKPKPQFIQWGSSDHELLKEQLLDSGKVLPTDLYMGYTSMNVKNINQLVRLGKGITMQGGLKKSLKVITGKDFIGIPHRADFDALNTAIMYQHFIDRERKLNANSSNI